MPSYLVEKKTESIKKDGNKDGATWCFRNEPAYKDVIKYGKISIGDNCFIGANVTILPGVTIGPNSIVGASGFVIVQLGLKQRAKIGKKRNRKETRQKLTTFAP